MASSKAGKSKLPPNPRQWRAEQNGLAFRERFRVDMDSPLRPFEIARQLNDVTLFRRQDLEGKISAAALAEAYGPSSNSWSAVTLPLNGHGHFIILNDSHAATRQNATLMEEFFHIILKHKPSRIYQCPLTGLMRREYDEGIENAAYWSAAAALVPYASLRSLVRSQVPMIRIAQKFEVSADLVAFRLKVTKQWRTVRRA